MEVDCSTKVSRSVVFPHRKQVFLVLFGRIVTFKNNSFKGSKMKNIVS